MIHLKVMAELPGRNKDSVKQFLDLRIPNLRLIQDFANEVYRELNLIGVLDFFSFDNNGRTDDTVGCGDVDQ